MNCKNSWHLLVIGFAVVTCFSACGREPGDVEPTAEPGGVEEIVNLGDVEKILIPDTSESIRMVYIKGGTFQMGSPSSEEGRRDGEGPVHAVTVTSFWMGETEVTQGQWMAIMGNNPSGFKLPGVSTHYCPVETVSWNDCQEFLKRLNSKISTGGFRLPSEAEWEYACRAGSQSRFCFGDDISGLGEYAWYKDNSGGMINTVGRKLANAFGLYDMHGNVYEWCQDWYGFYSAGAERDPKGPGSGPSRVMRGGGCGSDFDDCRSATRFAMSSHDANLICGFRVARTP